jgi:bla regulator protein blaR1
MLEVDNSGKVYFQKKETNLDELRKQINNGSYTSYHIEVAEKAPSSIMIDLRHLMAQNRLPGSVALCTTTETAQDKATPEMIAEYNRLVKYYNAMQNANPEGELQVKQEDINKIMAILGKMTPEQKKEAEQIKFDVPPPSPPAPDASAIEEYNSLVRKYNALPKDELQIKQEDINKIMSIRGRMTPEQKENAEQIKFDVPPPPPPAPAAAPSIPGKEKNPPVPPAPKRDTVHPNPFLWIKNVPPPPPPPSPIETVEEWIEEGAVFFFNEEKITGKEALEIVQKNNGKNLEVQVQEDSSGKTVRITDKKD